jgi:hypothetical protein
VTARQRYQSLRPLLAKGQGGLLLGVGDGESGFRYRISLFIPEKLVKKISRYIPE